MKSRKLGGLDYFKIAAAFLVVAIHTSPLASFSAEADFAFTRVAARIAVPFFFMVTGYFTLPRYLFGEGRASRSLFGQVRKTLLLYGAAMVIYLPVNVYAGQWEGVGAWEALRRIVFDGTFYHLWYLPAVVLGMGVVSLLGCLKGLGGDRIGRLYIGLSGAAVCLLYVIGLLGDSYYGFLKEDGFLYGCYEWMFRWFGYTRNGFFYAPVFLWMGAWIADRETDGKAQWEYGKTPKKERRDGNGGSVRSSRPYGNRGGGRKRGHLENNGWFGDVAGFLACFSLLVAEGTALHRLGAQRHDSMYIALPPCIFFLFRLLLRVRIKPKERLRTVSTWIYLLHPLAIVFIRGGAKAAHLEAALMDNSLLHYFAVCALSCLFAVLAQTVCSWKGKGENGKRGIRGKAGKTQEENIGMERRRGEREMRENAGKVRRIRKAGKADCRKGRAWIELNREALRKNVDALRRLLPPGCEFMPVLKANAYGHGAVLLARELNGYGIRSFCVATVMEAVELRKKGVRGEILILGYTHPEQFPLLRRHRLTQTVVDVAYAGLLHRYGKKVMVHIKVDTGMHRLGERSERVNKIAKIFQYKNLVVKGIYTHLSADDAVSPPEKAFTQAQGQAFFETVKRLEEMGHVCPKAHLQASYGVLNYPELAGDYARIGIALYGVLSSREDEGMLEGLTPVLSVKARVAAVKDLFPGEAAGYGFAYVAETTRRIAVLAVGYADGYARALSCGVGQVVVKGRKAPVVGYICMDQTIVDVTGIPGVKQGDVAVLIGREGDCEVSAYDWAQGCATITNEALSRLGKRLERIWV